MNASLENASSGGVGRDSPDLAFYATVKDYEHHFNSMEFEVRKIASVWLGLAFAAIAFVMRGELKDAGLLDAWATLVMIGFLGNVGMFTLWILDQVVYHGLLDAVFTIALRIEQKYPALPPVRSMMMVISGGRGMARFLSLFYLIPMLVLAVVAIIGVASMSGSQGRLLPMPIWWTLATAAVLLPLYTLWKWRSMILEKELRAEKASPAFAALYRMGDASADKDGFLQIVRRWYRGSGP